MLILNNRDDQVLFLAFAAILESVVVYRWNNSFCSCLRLHSCKIYDYCMTLSSEISIGKKAEFTDTHIGSDPKTTLEIFFWRNTKTNEERSIKISDVVDVAGILVADLANCEPPVIVTPDDIEMGETHKFNGSLVGVVMFEVPYSVIPAPESGYKLSKHIAPPPSFAPPVRRSILT
jgi:hypothetical protein